MIKFVHAVLWIGPWHQAQYKPPISNLKYFPGEYLLITTALACDYAASRTLFEKVSCSFNDAWGGGSKLLHLAMFMEADGHAR